MMIYIVFASFYFSLNPLNKRNYALWKRHAAQKIHANDCDLYFFDEKLEPNINHAMHCRKISNCLVQKGNRLPSLVMLLF